MKPITFSPVSYMLNGVPTYLNSGEFHYFRVPKSDWRWRMKFFKEAGGNALATYIPWLLHEPEEGRFAWGNTVPYLDFEGFLETAEHEELVVIARPGPYQYSELIYDGLPGWLCNQYPDLLARNRQGVAFRKSSVSYVHPLFWDKVRRWFDVVCPIIADFSIARGGPIAFVQIDNEMTGIHEWFGSLDYNPVAMGFGNPKGRYPTFLARRFGEIAHLNTHYGTSYARFEQVEPPDGSGRDAFSIRRRKDYFHFYLGTIAEYSRFLVDQMHSHGIETPIVHNSANPGMNTYFLETAAVLGKDFLLGSDHYYTLDQTWAQNHPTPQYAARVFLSLEELRLMGFPPTVFELPGGSCSDWPPFTPSDALACYLTNLAFGMKGHNYYIFTGGPNPPGAGSTTDIYDYNAAIGSDNQIRPLYQAQKAFGQVIANHPWLPAANRLADFRLALDLEAARSEQYWAGRGDFPLSPQEAWDLLRKGPLTTALCAGLSPEMARLDAPIPRGLPLVVVSSVSMSAAKQQNLVAYLKSGGKALIMPILPTLDEDLRPCTILAEYLGNPQGLANPGGPTRPSFRFGDSKVVNVLGEVTHFWPRIPVGVEWVGVDENSGRTIAWKAPLQGGGEVILLSFKWTHAMFEHEGMLKILLKALGQRPIVQCSNANIWVTVWSNGEKTVAFLLNLFTAPFEAEVRINLPGGKTINTGVHQLGPVSVKVVDV